MLQVFKKDKTTGIETDGIATDRIATEGIATMGIANKGVATEGIATSRIALNGFKTDGIATVGITTIWIAIASFSTTGITTAGQLLGTAGYLLLLPICTNWATCSWETLTMLNPQFVAGEHGLFWGPRVRRHSGYLYSMQD